MYELLILGILRTRDMSAYKLGRVLGGNLVPRREISNGVFYPLLNRLADQGYIEINEAQADPRKKKMTRITQKGMTRFQELMAVPVSMDAKRESMYRFKFRGMDGVDEAEQYKILEDYENANQTDLNIYQSVQDHLKQKLQAPDDDRVEALQWGVRALGLSIAICETKQKWIEECRTQIGQEKE
ncbi:PadR family transcriptional regulator [Pediococcus inopinatus]|uniref:PadR family transcriptional regulator n=1 Tax=Pediococcus TaxID=1253 RepID=UPI0007122E64|nr:PadR family transcriptional regulator [Pediococcus inopinatus]KRN62372.1 transcriptional regulator [Pediococcus inopinatus]WPC16752.1 PadR family transcriptional regulator [Pediococcus inopinatus]